MSEVELELLTVEQAAKVLKVSPKTLEKWRSEGVGPAFVRLGGRLRGPVRYRPSDLKAHLTGNLISTTTPPAPALAAAQDKLRGLERKVQEQLQENETLRQTLSEQTKTLQRLEQRWGQVCDYELLGVFKTKRGKTISLHFDIQDLQGPHHRPYLIHEGHQWFLVKTIRALRKFFESD